MLFFLKKNICLCVYMCMCGFVYIHAGVPRGQTRAQDPLELESEEAVSCLMWVLGTKLGFSARTMQALAG